MKKIKVTSTVITSLFISGHALAAPAVLFEEGENNTLKITLDADNQPFAVFENDEDLWFVFGHREMADVTMPKSVRDAFNITGQSVLNVDAGVGFAVSFENAPNMAFDAQNQGANNAQPLSMLSLKEGLRISGATPQILKATMPEETDGFTVVPLHGFSSRQAVEIGQMNESQSYAGVVLSYKGKPLASAYKDGDLLLSFDRKSVTALSQNSPLLEEQEQGGQQKTTQQKDRVENENTIVLAQGDSKIILQKQPSVAEEKAEPKTTPKAVEAEEKLPSLPPVNEPQIIQAEQQPKEVVQPNPEPVKQADIADAPGIDRMFENGQNISKEVLAQPKLAKLKAPVNMPEKETAPTKPSVTSLFEKYNNTAEPRDTGAFDRAMEELRQAQQDIEQVYVPKVTDEEALPQVQALSSTVGEADAETAYNEFFGNEVARIADFSTPKEQPEAAIEEKELLVDLDPSTLTDEQLFMLAEEVLGDSVDEKAFKQRQEDLGVELEEESFFGDIDLIEVAADDALFKMYGDGSPLAYQEFYKRFLEGLAHVKDRKDKDLYRLGLAKLNLAYGRPFESLMVLDNMPKDEETGLPLNAGAKLMMGVANLIVNRPEDAEYYMDSAPEKYKKDYNTWMAVVAEQNDEDLKAVNLFEENIKHAATYPPEILKDVYLAYGRVLLRLERLSDLKVVMQELSSFMERGQLPPEGLLILARAAILERNDEMAEALLAQAAASDDPNIAFMAQYEFVDFLLSKGDLGLNQAISHLENLRYLWRGGKVESEILTQLGRMYIAEGRQRRGLERLKQHNVYFPNDNEGVQYSTDIMTKAFSHLYFDDETLTDHDLIELLGIYYDYRELTPPGDEGDALISSIAERLRTLQLFDRAIDLMESQLKFRADTDIEKASIGATLAELYDLNREYSEGLNTLNRTEVQNLPQALQDKRSLIQASLLMGQRKYDEALKVLALVKDPRKETLISRISWILSEYPEVIKRLQPFFDNPSKPVEAWGEDEKTSLMELAVSYNVTGRIRDLESLYNRYKKYIQEDQNLENIFDYLMMDRGSDIVVVPEQKDGVWQNLTDAMKEYYTFVDFYQDYRGERVESREDKDMFNRRMRQMSAPARL